MPTLSLVPDIPPEATQVRKPNRRKGSVPTVTPIRPASPSSAYAATLAQQLVAGDRTLAFEVAAAILEALP